MTDQDNTLTEQAVQVIKYFPTKYKRELILKVTSPILERLDRGQFLDILRAYIEGGDYKALLRVADYNLKEKIEALILEGIIPIEKIIPYVMWPNEYCFVAYDLEVLKKGPRPVTAKPLGKVSSKYLREAHKLLTEKISPNYELQIFHLSELSKGHITFSPEAIETARAMPFDNSQGLGEVIRNLVL